MRSRIALVALLSTAGARVAAAQAPEFVFRGGTLSLRSLPAVLSESKVARHLATGLTTRFVFTVEVGRLDGRPAKGEAQVRVRYDLWDERYLVERWDGRGDAPVGVQLTRQELAGWWRSLTLVLYRAATGVGAPPARVKVELVVLPFSQAEQRDAQDWLLRSFRGGQAESADSPSSTSNGPLGAFYGALLAASIGQRSLITYSWSVAVTVESR